MSGVLFSGLGFFSCFGILSLLAVILVFSAPKMRKEDKRSKEKYIRFPQCLKKNERRPIIPKLLPCCFGVFFSFSEERNREANLAISFLLTGSEMEWEHTKIYPHPFLGNQYTWRSVCYRSPSSCTLVWHQHHIQGSWVVQKQQIKGNMSVVIYWLPGCKTIGKSYPWVPVFYCCQSHGALVRSPFDTHIDLIPRADRALGINTMAHFSCLSIKQIFFW